MSRPALALLLALLVPARAPAGVVDRVAIVVDDELVLESDLRFEAVLANLDRSPLPFWAPTHGTPAERLEEAALVRALAGSVDLYQPSPREVAARLTALRERLGGAEGFRAFQQLWGRDETALAQTLAQRLVVERYLARNLPEDPSDAAGWLAATHALLAQVRPRFRVRRIPLQGPR
jgi:hypothetical protein